MITIPHPSFSTPACLPLSCCVFCFVHKKKRLLYTSHTSFNTTHPVFRYILI
ncbi:hypothetical protein EI94DRAFT_1716263, partial [Lactarius quietus]